MMSASNTRALVARRLAPQLRRALTLLQSALPVPVQRFASKAFEPLAQRWPLLARLVGLGPPEPSADGAPGVNSSAMVSAPAADQASTPPAPPASGAPPSTSPAAIASPPADTAPAPVRAGVAPGERQRLLTAIWSSPEYVDRAQAAQALADTTDAETTAALIAALRDTSSEVATAAAESLRGRVELPVVTALTEVVENLSGYFNPTTRVAAVRSLGSVLPRGKTEVLARSLTDQDAAVSLAAIGALVEREEDASRALLFGVLEDRRGFFLPITRQAAARGLSHLRVPEGGRVRAVLAGETDATVTAALTALLPPGG